MSHLQVLLAYVQVFACICEDVFYMCRYLFVCEDVCCMYMQVLVECLCVGVSVMCSSSFLLYVYVQVRCALPGVPWTTFTESLLSTRMRYAYAFALHMIVMSDRILSEL